MKLSIVTTLYRSAPYVREFYQRAGAVASRLGFEWELIFVNDGSPDDAVDVAIALFQEDARVVVVDLSRNFGHHKAMMTGLAHAAGDLVFLIDSDLEEEPELLERFYDELRAHQADVVYGVQARRKGGWFERHSGRAYYAVFNALSETPLPQNVITARLMSRRYVAALVAHREREMMIGGLWVLTGFKQVEVAVQKLASSETTYTLRHKLLLLVTAITAFSNKPLIGIFYLGSGIVVISFIAALALTIRVLFFGHLMNGWASIMVSLWLIGGLIIFCLGVIGIYMSKIFLETKQRPYTIVRALHQREREIPFDQKAVADFVGPSVPGGTP